MDRSKIVNRFEFVALAGQRARQLMSGCVPQVTLPDTNKLVRVAELEVASGVVQKLEDEPDVA